MLKARLCVTASPFPPSMRVAKEQNSFEAHATWEAPKPATRGRLPWCHRPGVSQSPRRATLKSPRRVVPRGCAAEGS